MREEAFFAAERRRMVQEDLLERNIRDPRVLRAMERIPRHRFVPPEHRRLAYADAPLPIGEGQTISQPYIVAYMVQLLSLDGNERVLDIGTGSGYQAAVLSYLAAEVYSIERYAELAEQASQRLRYLKFRNIHIHVGDGTEGLDQHAPFDRIVVAAGAPEAPPPLLEQLAEGGALVIPVGGRNNQILQRWVRFGDTYEREDFVPVAFVPLIGKFGW